MIRMVLTDVQIHNKEMKELEDLMDLVREAQEWGYEIHIYEMDDFDTMMDLDNNSAWEVACALHNGDFNPYHEYFEIDSYGHLYSYDEYGMLDHLRYLKDELKEFIESEA